MMDEQVTQKSATTFRLRVFALTGRVALRVQDWRASKIILDTTGAEDLLGKGDLIADLGRGPLRAQAPSPDLRHRWRATDLDPPGGGAEVPTAR